MPSSTLDDVIAAFQRSILRNERQTASEMVRVYTQGWKRIKAKLSALQTQYDIALASGESVGLNWIYQNNRLLDLQTLVGKELRRFADVADVKITAAQKKVINQSLIFSRDMTILRLGPQYDVSDFLRVKSLSTGSIEMMVGLNQAGSPLKRLLDGIKAKGSKDASDALIEGMMLGYNPRKIAPMIRDALGTQLNRALTIARTETMRVQRLATEANYKANSNIVKGWIWQAEVSGACAACLAEHGSEHPLSEHMSSHPNCRCVERPWLMSWDEIGKQFGLDFSNVDKAGPTFAEIAEKYGMSPDQVARYANNNMTGEAYFKTLSDDEQRKLLGPSKWQAYTEGKFKFEKLAKTTYNSTWGAGIGIASLKDLLGE